jgi:ABC-type bacteriocin/lantibiotic exporter with double-glycine peptidase domain
MRSLVITLKVAAFHFMKQITSEKPLLLFDEVLSELDEHRQRTLLEHLPSAQTLLTCTSIPEGIGRQDGVYVLDLRQILQDSEKHNIAATPKENEVSVQEEDLNEQVAVRT